MKAFELSVGFWVSVQGSGFGAVGIQFGVAGCCVLRNDVRACSKSEGTRDTFFGFVYFSLGSVEPLPDPATKSTGRL